MKRTILLALTSLSILCACGRDPEAAPTQAEEEGDPEITLGKPKPASIDLVAEAVQVVGPYRIPWVYADIRVEITGAEPIEVMADENGRVSFPIHQVWALSGRESGTITVQVSVRTEAREARASLEISREETDVLLQNRKAELLAVEANESNALAVLEFFPRDPDALFLLAKARDAQGNALGAVLGYREFLIGKMKSAARAREAKEHAILRTKELLEPLPIPTAAIDFMLASIECVKEEKWNEAYEACRMAQEVAPWWEEAYSRAAVIQAQAWVDGTCKGEIALEDFELCFLFGSSSEPANELRRLYETISTLKRDNDELTATWDEVKELYDLNSPALELIRGALQEEP